MKKTIIAMAMGVLICSGCTSTQKSYQTSATVTQTKQAHQYTVEFKIKDIEGKTENIVSAPKLIIKAGEKGEVRLCDEGGNNGVFCTALVTENENWIEAITKVTIKSEGKEDLSNTQTIIIKN